MLCHCPGPAHFEYEFQSETFFFFSFCEEYVFQIGLRVVDISACLHVDVGGLLLDLKPPSSPALEASLKVCCPLLLSSSSSLIALFQSVMPSYKCDCARYCKTLKPVGRSTYYAHAPFRKTLSIDIDTFRAAHALGNPQQTHYPGVQLQPQRLGAFSANQNNVSQHTIILSQSIALYF